MDTQAFVTQVRYSAWATKRVLESTAAIPQEEFVRDLGNSKFNETRHAGGLYGTLAHIYQADSIWFDRLVGKSTSDLSVYDAPVEHAALSKLWLSVEDRYVSWAEGLDAAGWDRVASYKDTKGNPYQTPVWQIVLHVVNHATYHRGQITTMLRQLGRPVVGLDLILYYRETSRAWREHAGRRLDHFLQEQLPDYSRSRLQEWVKTGRVLVNGIPKRASHLVREGDLIEVEPAAAKPLAASPEDIPLEILYEDSDLVAINKPAGMVVHAGAGVHSGTLVNALLHRFGALSTAGGEMRPGIVHRLDRQTSGVLLVAKNDAAHRNLAAQFASRRVTKTYTALVHGVVKADHARIEKPIARDPVRRIRMTARLASGRSAWSEYRVLRRFEKFTLLEVRIGTGRTHQIRVHLASIGHPVAGDKLYGAPAGASDRFFLHAARIQFAQPSTGEPVEVSAPLPADLEEWLVGL